MALLQRAASLAMRPPRECAIFAYNKNSKFSPLPHNADTPGCHSTPVRVSNPDKSPLSMRGAPPHVTSCYTASRATPDRAHTLVTRTLRHGTLELLTSDLSKSTYSCMQSSSGYSPNPSAVGTQERSRLSTGPSQSRAIAPRAHTHSRTKTDFWASGWVK